MAPRITGISPAICFCLPQEFQRFVVAPHLYADSPERGIRAEEAGVGVDDGAQLRFGFRVAALQHE
jgi:hypothetical protein